MKASERQDYRVFETTNTAGEVRWEIKLGGADGYRVTTCRSLVEAERQAVELNLDPYYFDRKAQVVKTKSIVKED